MIGTPKAGVLGLCGIILDIISFHSLLIPTFLIKEWDVGISRIWKMSFMMMRVFGIREVAYLVLTE